MSWLCSMLAATWFACAADAPLTAAVAERHGFDLDRMLGVRACISDGFTIWLQRGADSSFQGWKGSIAMHRTMLDSPATAEAQKAGIAAFVAWQELALEHYLQDRPVVDP